MQLLAVAGFILRARVFSRFFILLSPTSQAPPPPPPPASNAACPPPPAFSFIFMHAFSGAVCLQNEVPAAIDGSAASTVGTHRWVTEILFI